MNITFLPLTVSDFPLVAAWLGEPHVQKWRQEPATIEHVSREYGGCTRGDFATRVFVVKVAGHPIGLIQSYITDDYPEHAESLQMPGWVGIDYFIGDKKYVGRRYGPTMILDFRAKVVVNYYPEAPGLVADPETDNVASIRALEKAGFVKDRIACGEHGQEQLMTLRLGT